jgi:hypothetical protein
MSAWWWERTPRLTGRWSHAVATALGDGIYLSAWPAAGALLPLAAIAAGAAVTIARPAPVFTASWATVVTGLAAGGLSGSLGAWFWAGYVATDLITLRHAGGVVHGFIPLLLSYLLAWSGFVNGPTIAERVRLQWFGTAERRGWTEAGAALTQAALTAGVTLLWMQAVIVLVRPAFTWRGLVPPDTALRTMTGLTAPLVAAAAAAVRVVIEGRAVRTPRLLDRARALDRDLSAAAERRRAGRASTGLATVALTTWLLGAVIATWIDAAVFVAATIATKLGSRHVSLVPAFRRLPLWAGLLVSAAISMAVYQLAIADLASPLWRALDAAIPCGRWSAWPGCDDALTRRPLLGAIVVSSVLIELLVPTAPGIRHRGRDAPD